MKADRLHGLQAHPVKNQSNWCLFDQDVVGLHGYTLLSA